MNFQDDKVAGRWACRLRFIVVGATLGLAIGVLEGGLLFCIPRFSGLLRPDIRFVIWFVAPLSDMIAGAIIAFALGTIAAAARPRSLLRGLALASGAGLAGAYVGWLLDWFRIGAGVVFPRQPGTGTLAESFLAVFLITFSVWSVLRPRSTRNTQPRYFRRLAVADLITAAVLAAGITVYAVQRSRVYFNPPAQDFPTAVGKDPSRSPNIILMVLDTVRADHLSCYGYSRPTTSAIDKVAAHGTVFENVYAPTSWTLASLASIFTGLLPHQHGADWGIPLARGPWTLARILRAQGYETAGFSSNSFYGLGAWRLSEGFDFYVDDSYSIRHNLAATLLGQSVLESLYDHLVRYNQFDQRNAADVNQDVLRWYSRRDRARPFFLFINYMDAHRPYLPPSPYDRRFGKIPRDLLPQLMAPLKNGHPRRPYTARERQAIVDGYDNSLAYLDHQIGSLLGVVDAQESRTVLIITSDHGEGFGEHRTYDHGWNLYPEVLHVPLIIEGPGVPAGLRIPAVVASRQLFSTVLNFARIGAGLAGRTSLARFWNPHFRPHNSERAVVSELGADRFAHRGAASVSLITSQWQYVLDSHRRDELYNRQTDPRGKTNLAGQPGNRAIVSELRSELKARLTQSVMPWYGPAYLTLLDQPGATFLKQVSQHKENLPPSDTPIGALQEYISHNPPRPPLRPNKAQQELLRSLPYH